MSLPNQFINFVGSQLLAITENGGTIFLLLHVCLCQPKDGKLADWTQRAALLIKNGKISGAVEKFPAEIFEGEFYVHDSSYLSLSIPFFDIEEAFRLKLTFYGEAGSVLTVNGSGASLQLIGEPHLIEFSASGQ